ncbi:MAG: four helix bundle protein [Cytophagales bacterium]|nr:MAG: four helix bundle protein [Cytophagales bacterium]
MKIERFEDLNCWKEARILSKMIFKLAQNTKLEKDFGTRNQLTRAAISIMNNIAEGFGRYHHKEFIRFLDFSQSSASEVKSMLYLLEDIEYASYEELKLIHLQLDKTKNLTLGLIKY